MAMQASDDDLDKRNEATESQCIPEDVEGIVLAFLPGRDVVKFRTVCKLWRDCVEQPIFVDRHLNNSFRFHQSIACFTSLDDGLVHMYTFDPTTMNLRNVDLVFTDRLYMSDPCNGLVCAYDWDGGAEVLNPITRKHLQLPVSELRSQFLFSEYFVGFVQSTKEYKVVSICHSGKFLAWEIFTIGTFSWRKVRQSAELLKTTKAVIVNDAMYWLLLDEASSGSSREILVLNLTDEKFSKIATPDAVKDHVFELLEGEGKLLLLSLHSDVRKPDLLKFNEAWMADLTHQDWVRFETATLWVPLGMRPIFMLKMKIFFGYQNNLVCADLLKGTCSYIDIRTGENMIACGTFVESFAPALTGLVSSAAAGESYLTGWSSSDLEESFKRAKRSKNMEWKSGGFEACHLTFG